MKQIKLISCVCEFTRNHVQAYDLFFVFMLLMVELTLFLYMWMRLYTS